MKSFTNMLSGRLNYIYTLLIFACYLTYGLQEIISSTLLDIAEITGATVAEASFGISVKYFGYLCGSLAIGWLLDHVLNRQVGLALSVVGTASALASIPITRTLYLYYIAMWVNGFLLVCFDVASFTWITEMWQPNHNPFMQALFLANALGVGIAPAIAGPFLSHVWNGTLPSGVHAPVFHPSRIVVPYLMMAGTAALMSLLMTLMYLKYPYSITVQENDNICDESEAGHSAPVAKSSPVATTDTGDVIRSCCLVAACAAIMTNCVSFLPTFLIFCDWKFSKVTAAKITSAAVISSGVTLCTTIWIATKLTAMNMLHIILVILAGGCLLTAVSLRISETMTIIAILISSLGVGCLLPTAYSHLSDKMTVTNQMYGWLTMGKSVIRILIPFAVGSFVEKHALVFVYFNLLSICLCFLILLLMQRLQSRSRQAIAL